MLQALPVLVANLEEHRKKTMYGQVGFFDLGGDDSFGMDFEMPDVEEFPKAELLKMEKEMTGLYLSGHPLDKYEDIVMQRGYARIGELLEAEHSGFSGYKDNDRVTLCGIITRITIKQTRGGQNMAFVTVEDMTGSMEIIVFPKVLEECSDRISASAVITVSGTLSVEEEKEPKVLANEVSGAPDQTAHPASESGRAEKTAVQNKNKHPGLFLRFSSRKDARIEKARIITSIFDGSFPLYFYYMDEKHYELQKPSQFVLPNDTMLAELKRILGEDNVALMG